MASLVVFAFTADAAPAATIALQRTASISGDAVTLADVAELTGEYAKQLADVKLAELNENESKRTLSLRRIRQKLNKGRDVHWGRLILSGPLNVRIHRGEATASPRPAESSTSRATAPGSAATGSSAGSDTAAANPLAAVSVGSDAGATPGGLTLRRQIIRFLQNQTNARADDLRVTFRDPDSARLDTTIRQARFEIEPLSSDSVGRLPIVVRRYENGQPTGTHRVRVRVEVRRQVVAAARTIGRGQTITDSDLKTKTLWLDTDPARLATNPARLIGQRAASLLRAGDLIEADDTEPPLLVERGQMVIVRCISGGLVVRTIARAMEDGHKGQSIELRNERTRESFRAEVTGPKEAVLHAGPIRFNASRPSAAGNPATPRAADRNQPTQREDAS